MKRALHLALATVAALPLGCDGSSAASPGPRDAGGTGEADAAAPIHADCADGWCRIPSGSFTMGSPADESSCRAAFSEDQVQVTLTHAFSIQQFELTQKEWTSLGFKNPSGLMKDGTGDCADPECPVGNVTWFEAVAFANALSSAKGLPPCYDLIGYNGNMGEGMTCTGEKLEASSLYECSGFRLATDAEWERAVRAGTTTAYYSGHATPKVSCGDCVDEPALDDIAWYCINAGKYTHPVGQKKPNAFGLYDMAGNANEWIDTAYYSMGYGSAPLVDPFGLATGGTERIRRGGIWNYDADICRSAAHLPGIPTARGPGLGFRLVRTLQPGE
jgi:formylglycine-generating enzyme required for sulfatase activity